MSGQVLPASVQPKLAPYVQAVLAGNATATAAAALPGQLEMLMPHDVTFVIARSSKSRPRAKPACRTSLECFCRVSWLGHLLVTYFCQQGGKAVSNALCQPGSSLTGCLNVARQLSGTSLVVKAKYAWVCSACRAWPGHVCICMLTAVLVGSWLTAACADTCSNGEFVNGHTSCHLLCRVWCQASASQTRLTPQGQASSSAKQDCLC